MLNLWISICLALSLFQFAADVRAQVDLNSPVGVWLTIDDRTKKPKLLVRIFEADGGTHSGKVEKLMEPGQADRICDKCPGDYKDKPVLGMTFMTGLKKFGAEWRDGQLLDPESGNIYRCKMKLLEGNKLEVRGFIGVSLFGRSQIWVRQEQP